LYTIITLDINECETVSCHEKAQCVNTDGSYECQCKLGYSGDGKTSCEGKFCC